MLCSSEHKADQRVCPQLSANRRQGAPSTPQITRYDRRRYPRMGTVSLRKPYKGLTTQGAALMLVSSATCAAEQTG